MTIFGKSKKEAANGIANVIPPVEGNVRIVCTTCDANNVGATPDIAEMDFPNTANGVVIINGVL